MSVYRCDVWPMFARDLVFFFFPWGILLLRSDWSLSCDHALDCANSRENSNSKSNGKSTPHPRTNSLLKGKMTAQVDEQSHGLGILYIYRISTTGMAS